MDCPLPQPRRWQCLGCLHPDTSKYTLHKQWKWCSKRHVQHDGNRVRISSLNLMIERTCDDPD